MNRPIPIFAAERRDGLADLIQANASVSYLAPVKIVTPADVFVAQAREAIADAAKKPIEDSTLIYFEDILATTGWNLNADVFTHEELWAARHTIDNKPINLEHKYQEIVGHVVGSYAVDADFMAIAEDAAIDELPAKFHVKNESVLYRKIGDPERDAYMATLEAEIAAGEWFVSMELFFNGFDYGVRGDDGSKAILPRSEATAFLTKHMWQYGGDGTYLDPKTGRSFGLGRVMKNIHFKGKGVVKRPGNPESVIFASVDSFQADFAAPGYVTKAGSADAADAPKQEIETMPEPSVELSALQLKLDAALADVTRLTAENLSLASKDTEAKVAGLESAKTSLESEVATLKTQADAYVAAIATLNTEVATLKTDLDAKSVALAAIEAEKTAASRLAAIVAEGADASLAEALVKQFAAMDAAKFAETVAVLAPSWKKAPVAETKAAAEKRAIDDAVADEAPAFVAAATDEDSQVQAELIAYYTNPTSTDA